MRPFNFDEHIEFSESDLLSSAAREGRENIFDKQELALAAATAIRVLASGYLARANPIVNLSPRAKFLETSLEEICDTIQKTGTLPIPESDLSRNFNESSLWEEEVLMMAIVASIQKRGVQSETVVRHLLELSQKYLSLRNFALYFFDTIGIFSDKPEEVASHLVDMVITKYRLMTAFSPDSPLALELSALTAEQTDLPVSDLIKLIVPWLGSKWEKGLLVMGDIPTQDKRSIAYSLILPDLPAPTEP